ncbi:2-hydroxyacid dehydrogenase [Zavarzinia sp.]|uniref:2-hydroxyacid dehydrogenase n=1 Tax=Zavarzinia sp. TaxID=2027920 RepID=UPI003563B5D6
MKRIILFSSDLDDPAAWGEAVAARRPDLAMVDWRAIEDPEAVEFALMWKPPPGGLSAYRNLKGIQSLGAGVNQLDLTALPPGVPLARLVDASLTDTMVDYALAATLRHFRGFDRFERQTRARLWDYAPAPAKADFPVGVMGIGVLGGAVAAALRDLGFPVLGWSRTARAIEGVQCFAGTGELPDFLARCRLVINVLALTPETAGILNAGTFALMQKGSFVVNIGRGAHLVEADLIAAIEAGQIAGATLDVFSEEPLPADHPIYGRPEILVTPHVAGSIAPSSAAATVIENFERAVRGETMLNAVDLARGY